MRYAIMLMFSITLVQAKVLATVNGEKITLKDLRRELSQAPDDIKKAYEDDLPGFLEELITQEVLYQKVEELKVDTTTQDKDILIRRLLEQEVVSRVKIKEEEIKKFYNEHKGEMKGATYKEIKSRIRDFLKNQKINEAVGTYIEKLKDESKITRNNKWIKAEKKKLKDPVARAMKNGLPTIVDFGAGTCKACIEMQPIIEGLQKEYKGKANVIPVDVQESQPLSRKYNIMLIPTQIFYDKKGNEVYRHIGFFPKDSILVRLKDCGLK